MARWIVAGLVVLNLLLAGGVYLRMGGEKKANAQIGKPASDAAIVAGQSNAKSIVYILDLSNGDLVAMETNPTQNKINRVAPVRNVTEDMKRFFNQK